MFIGACTPDNISAKNNMSIDNDIDMENVVTEIGNLHIFWFKNSYKTNIKVR